MDIVFLFGVFVGVFVFLYTETDHVFLRYEYNKRVNTLYKHIDPEIELFLIQEQRLINVLLNNEFLLNQVLLINLLDPFYQFNAKPTPSRGWFCNEKLFISLVLHAVIDFLIVFG